MKRRNLLLTLTLALGLGIGVVAGLSAHKEVKEAKAEGETETVWVEIGNNCDWASGKIAIGFWGSGDHFSDLVTINSTDKFYKLTYTPNSGDTGCNVILYGSNKESANWSDIVNQTKNMTIGNQYTVWDKDTSDGKYWFTVDYRDTTKSASFSGELSGDFDTFKRSGSDTLESVKTGVAVTSGQKFKIAYDSVEYAILNSYVSTDLFDTTTNEGYITAKSTGNFDMYFDTSTHALWVEENAEEAAISFSQKFNTAMATPCADQNANNSVAVSAIWDTWKDAFEALTPAAKTQFSSSSDDDVVQARTLYLHCVTRYSLTAWSDAPTASNVIFPISNQNSTNMIAMIVVVSSISLIAVSGFFFLKRKHSK